VSLSWRRYVVIVSAFFVVSWANVLSFLL
jgi:hypothetical protein